MNNLSYYLFILIVLVLCGTTKNHAQTVKTQSLTSSEPLGRVRIRVVIKKLILSTDVNLDQEITNDTTLLNKKTDENGILDISTLFKPGFPPFDSYTVISDDNGAYNSMEKTFTYKELKEKKEIKFKLIKKGTIIEPFEPKIEFSNTTLLSSGYPNLGQALHHLAPNFHSTPQILSDLTDVSVPSTLNGLNPDHFLITINEKRKGTSSILNVNRTIGRGSVSSDINAIPISWIKSIEIKPTSSSVKYGSDAIAGVVNIILKSGNKDVRTLVINGNITSGSPILGPNKDYYYPNDGKNTYATLNFTIPISSRGFLLVGGDLNYLGAVNRSGPYDFTSKYTNKYGIYIRGDSIRDLKEVSAKQFWKKTSFIGIDSLNPKVIEAGRAGTSDANIYYNFSLPIAIKDNGKIFSQPELYSFGSMNSRQGISSGFYRFPWDQSRGGGSSLYPNGFSPKIQSYILDYFFTFGFKSTHNKWTFDLNNAYSLNSVDVGVRNSINASLGNASPTSFNAGAFSYSQNVTSFDAKWSEENIQIELGTQLRMESYNEIEGDTSSYSAINNGKEPYSQVFPGIQPTNAIEARRNNAALYSTFTWNKDEKFILNAGARYERYNSLLLNSIDNLSFKLAGLTKIGDFSIRASFNTGFKAPSLAQNYFSSISTQSSGSIVKQVTTVNSTSQVRASFPVNPLKPELSAAINFGITYHNDHNDKDFEISLDAFRIGIRDRIILSGQIDADSPDFEFLKALNVSTAQFFLNAVNSETYGLIANINYKNKVSDKIDLSINLNAYQSIRNKIKGLPNFGGVLSGKSSTLFDAEEANRLTDAQPNGKFISTISGNIEMPKKGMIEVQFRGTYIGDVNHVDRNTFVANENTLNKIEYDLNQTYGGRFLLDSRLSYQLGISGIAIYVGMNNILNEFPTKNKWAIINSNSNQFIFSRHTPQFDLTGRYFYTGLRLNL